MTRSLNKVSLIGNLTRDPELRYTPQGTAICTIGLATNRQWEKDGQKQEDVEFHRLVAWNKLAELCAQLLAKGRKIYVEGRLQTRKWTGTDEVERTTTEIVINEMIILDSRGAPDDGGSTVSDDQKQTQDDTKPAVDTFDPDEVEASAQKSSKKPTKPAKDEPQEDDDIPF